MVIPLHITFLNLPPSEAIDAAVRKHAEKLDRFSDHIIRCEVTVEITGKHKQQGRPFEVRIDLTAPKAEIAISHDHQHEDVYVAMREAFDAVTRKLQDYVRTRRGDVKAKVQDLALHGRVTKLSPEGYGYIETADRREYYFHRDNLVQPDFEQMAVGTEVQFLEDGSGDELKAKRVSTGKHRPPLE